MKRCFVRMKGLEPSRDYLPLEPESSASTNSATSANSLILVSIVCEKLWLQI